MYIAGTSTGASARWATANGAFESGTTALTLCMWLRLPDYGAAVGSNSWFLMKPAHPTTWAAPYFTAALYMNMVASGTPGISFLVYLNGTTLVTASTTGLQYAPLHEWFLLAGTFDGTLVKLYINSILVAASGGSGTIVYPSGGNSSPWTIGEPAGLQNGSEWSSFYCGPVWIENVTRTQAQLLARYQAGAKRY